MVTIVTFANPENGTGDYIRIELAVWGRTQDENKVISDALYSKKEQIESDFGNALVWERMDNKQISRIKFENPGVSIFNEADWNKKIEFMLIYVPKFEAAFKNPISQLSRK